MEFDFGKYFLRGFKSVEAFFWGLGFECELRDPCKESKLGIGRVREREDGKEEVFLWSSDRKDLDVLYNFTHECQIDKRKYKYKFNFLCLT